MPIAHDHGSDELTEFINKYEDVLSFIKTLTGSYMFRSEYEGHSICRICGITIMNELCHNGGDGEYTFLKDKMNIVVPDGYIHYLYIHNVPPSKEFYDYIINFDKNAYIKKMDIYNDNGLGHKKVKKSKAFNKYQKENVRGKKYNKHKRGKDLMYYD